MCQENYNTECEETHLYKPKPKRRILEIDKENGYKICNSCNIKKDLVEFDFREDKQRYLAHCHDCDLIKHKEAYRKTHIIKPKLSQLEIDISKGNKKCCKCQNVKSLEEFTRHPSRNQYYPRCEKCRQEDWTIKNRRYRNGEMKPIIKQIEIDRKNGFKFCHTCNTEKSIDEFYYSKSEDKLSYQCKICDNNKNKSRRIRTVRIPQYKIDESNGYKKCKKCDTTKELKEFRFRLIDNKYPTYCTDCRKCEIAWTEEYRRKNIDRTREIRRNNNRRYRKNVLTKLHSIVSSAINKHLNGGKNNVSWITMVDFSVKQLKEHLEKNFKEGMTWENREKLWHIHHVLPKRLFKFDSFEHKEFQICWSLSNLMPEYNTVNMSIQDMLDNGKRARDLTEEERIAYIRSKGHDI